MSATMHGASEQGARDARAKRRRYAVRIDGTHSTYLSFARGREPMEVPRRWATTYATRGGARRGAAAHGRKAAPDRESFFNDWRFEREADCWVEVY
ncbi:MAG: hypothetical protein C0497_04250 [Gemmatimonas sp.]|nr:hypothetical protein [Gemmatimonas sp.]